VISLVLSKLGCSKLGHSKFSRSNLGRWKFIHLKLGHSKFSRTNLGLLKFVCSKFVRSQFVHSKFFIRGLVGESQHSWGLRTAVANYSKRVKEICKNLSSLFLRVKENILITIEESEPGYRKLSIKSTHLIFKNKKYLKILWDSPFKTPTEWLKHV
jgi:hypothetical protein